MTTFNVRDFGATGDGLTDDAPAFRAALAAGVGGSVLVPDGTYVLGRDGSAYWCVTLPAGTWLHGESREGTILVQAPGIGGSVRLLQADAAGSCVDTMTLDGNKTNQSPDEHRAGVFASKRVEIRNITSRNFTGDGIYLYTGADHALVTGVLATGNTRNGLTLGGRMTGPRIYQSIFVGNGAQQFDSEPPAGQPITDVLISECTMDGGGISGDYVLTIAGGGNASQSTDWLIDRCTFVGPVEVVWASRIDLRDCIGTSATDKAALTIYRACDRITVGGCGLSGNGIGGAHAVIDITGTGAGQQPDNVVLSGNTITATGPIINVRVLSARGVTMRDNEIVGIGVTTPFVFGVSVRSAVAGAPIQLLAIVNNRITDTSNVGIVTSAAPGAFGFVDIRDNTFTSTTGSMATATSLAPASETIRADNVLVGSCSAIGPAPAGIMQSWGDGGRWMP